MKKLENMCYESALVRATGKRICFLDSVMEFMGKGYDD